MFVNMHTQGTGQCMVTHDDYFITKKEYLKDGATLAV